VLKGAEMQRWRSGGGKSSKGVKRSPRNFARLGHFLRNPVYTSPFSHVFNSKSPNLQGRLLRLFTLTRMITNKRLFTFVAVSR
jgi:hypothetical protein